jgi:hypothetical protein
MTESTGSVLSLTGSWIGHYMQRDRVRGIAADLQQEGERLSGQMRDAETVFELSIFELAAECGLPPGADEQIVSALREQFPDEPRAPIRAVSSLASDSLLEGSVRGRTVTFLKTYQGEAFHGYRVGGREVGTRVAGHSVHYRGQISADGQTLEGHWWIDPEPDRTTRRTEGTFVLRRQPDPAL